jgi:hypothetical protein
MAKNNLSQGLQSQLTGMSEDQALKTLQQEARRLKYIAVKLWRQDMNSYQPKQYIRTRDAQKSIKLGKPFRIDQRYYGIRLEYDDSLAYHPSIFKGGSKGHAIILISYGWHSKKLERKIGKEVYRFTYFDGTKYIPRVMDEFMKFAPKGISLELEKKS